MAEKKGADFSRPTAESSKSSVAAREEATLDFWLTNKIFEKSVAKPAPKGEYIFYDGPPFATGLPHYGHIVASVIKDIVPRYWTMRGYSVPRVWGWDCHGLPIENIVEKMLGFKHKKDIKEFGVEKFNEKCREQVLTYAHEWEKVIPRIGRWADMHNAYRTMDKPFMESVWWAFKEIYDKGLVYEDYRSMHICPRCETTLSQQEVSEGYKDIKDIAVTIKFESVEEPGTYFLAWTTTPWTLPGNVALAVGADVDYVKVKNESGVYVLGKEALARYQEQLADAEVIGEMKGSELVGTSYKPLFDYYVNDQNLKNRENGWKVYAATFVTAASGTGIAHEAPAFGADDWDLLKEKSLPFVQHINYDGTVKPEVTAFAGRDLTERAKGKADEVREIDLDVKKYLDERGLLFAWEKYQHSYPHCWRCDTALLFYATSSWFVNITKMKGDILENAKSINWSPENIKEGRWGKWLEGARDWSISRQRFWASCIPIWVCEACKKQRVFGSAAELEEASGQRVDDLHKHVIDKVTISCECGGTMIRIPDVFDTWFDSGSMPYGEKHYPFENKERFDAAFPAQFIAEGLDQTRAWFYYMHVLASGIFNKNAFQNVIVNGIVLAEDGKKMSKKLQNYPDPMLIVDRYGADALRYYLMSSPVVQGENLNFNEKDVDDALKKNIGRLNNVLAFYQLYENGTPRDYTSTHVLDRWILARLAALVAEVTQGFEAYRLDAATRPIGLFIDDLSVWYLRRSRDRFKDEGDDKEAALATLRYVLHMLARVIAPSMPFFAEHLFQAVKEAEDEESVHLASWPDRLELAFDAEKDLAYMFATRALVSQALELRDKAKIKVRQPLAKLILPIDPNLPEEYLEIVRDEVNIKKIEVGSTFALDTTITEALRAEGVVRDTIREIQAFRKERGLVPGEKAAYLYAGADKEIVKRHVADIEEATATEIQFD